MDYNSRKTSHRKKETITMDNETEVSRQRRIQVNIDSFIQWTGVILVTLIIVGGIIGGLAYGNYNSTQLQLKCIEAGGTWDYHISRYGEKSCILPTSQE